MSSLIRILRPFVSKSPFLSELYRDWREARTYKKTPKKVALGFFFSGNEAMENGRFEPIETRHILNLLTRTSTVINVGANIGYYCCLALKEGKHVVAFEPMPSNQKHLLRNVFLNNWSANFECYSMALSDKSGLIEIFGGGTGASLVKGWAGQENSTIVPVSTLDTVLGNRFSAERPLIIVDIEGAEYNMLNGAKTLLESKAPPIWFVEISVSEHQPKGVQVNPNLTKTFELFMERGYSAISTDEAPRQIKIEEVKEIEKTKIDTLKQHNFIFAESSLVTELLELLST